MSTENVKNKIAPAGTVKACDDLGRVLPTSKEAGSRRKNRYVGLFYFLWSGEHSRDVRPLDIEKLLEADPQAGYRPDDDEWGKYSVMHHWGEPLFGYYFSKDEWVMRRHVEMLTYSDIDFLVFDTTNAVIYEETAKMMLRLLSEYRAMGFNTPKAMFYTNTASGKTVQMLYDSIYSKGYMSDSWFCFGGKPLIIAREEECSPETREFFTIKMSQWPNEPTKQGGWPWMDFERPQRVFENLDGEEEIINVSIAQHPQIRFGDSAMYGETTNRGRSFHNGAEDKSEGAWKFGYNFQEQWDRALETDPPYVFVTGWNEWIAGRWGGTPERPLCFVDCVNLEYSRDAEPMRGGYFDNYYMQLISNVRHYKGTDEAEVQPELVTDGDGEVTMDLVAEKGLCYANFPKGGFERSCKGYDTFYKDDSGRHAIRFAYTAHDKENLYFCAETEGPIEKYDYNSAWMQLFLNVENLSKSDYSKRWKGYNYIANGYQFTGTRTTLEACVCDGDRSLEADTFRPCAVIDFEYKDNRLMVRIPKKCVGIGPEDRFEIQFKWMDSRRRVRGEEDFYTSGDAAPIGRLNYVFLG
ncbi:MAG: hypothetical protein J5950_01130 [Clostridia bacterium]|nr:hypothetical protein [Clostridia bacterium]